MGIRTDHAWRQQLIFFSIIIMLVALFTSRVLLTVGMVSFLFFTCVHGNVKEQFSNFFGNPLLIGMSLLFFMPLISGLWSEDKTQWLRWVRIKLPLFLFPYAFAGPWQLNKKQWRVIAHSFILLVFIGCCWTLWHYSQNFHDFNNAYLRAHAIPTPLENDHIRFSLLVCVAIITATYLINSEHGRIRSFLIFIGLFFVVYLHILFARTGLIAFYLFAFLGLLYLVIRSKNKKFSVAILVALFLMPVAAWFFLPTFQNRIRYIIYDFSHIQRNAYLPGSNDGTRMLSLKAGWYVLKENPFGTGAGDVVNESFQWYDNNIPGMLKTDKIYPASEWLLYGGVAGWIGVVLFTVIMILPCFAKVGNRFYLVSVGLVSAFSLVFDVGLETQFGVFIYAFIILWWWKSGRAALSGQIAVRPGQAGSPGQTGFSV